jgi:nitrogen regulatory protein P-II 1
MQFKLIMALVKEDLTDGVIKAMKEAGATGATIVPARGTGIHEAKSFFGLNLEAQTEILLFLVEEHVVERLMEVLQESCRFDKPGTGIAFVLPIEHVLGLESQMEKFRKQARDEYF